jgi:hypothetical protein
LNNSLVSGNRAVDDGGGVFNTGDLTVTDNTIKQNTASRGGGIHNEGVLVVTNSTIHNNDTVSPIGKGGGINSWSVMTLTNVTISHNTAADDGGGIEVGNGSPTLIRHSTIINNAATGSIADSAGVGGGIFYFFDQADVVTILNTIIANNSGNTSQNHNCFGPMTSQGHNLASDNSCVGFTAPGDLTNTDPLLDSLQNNGGPTETHALLPGSPAIDAGSCAGVTTDQRGANRPIDQPEPNADDGCDIGAFELQ